MFADAEPHEDVEKLSVRRSTGSSKFSISSHDPYAVEHASYQDKNKPHDDPPQTSSVELKRTASNVLSKVASRMTTISIPEPPPPPDGGLHAWTQVACGWIVILTTWGWVNSYGAFQSYYTVSLGLPPSTVSWIGSVQNFLTFFIGAFSGRLLDAGYFIPCFLIGSIVQVLGIFFMSLSTKYWQLMLSQGIMTGIGGASVIHLCNFHAHALSQVASYSRPPWGCLAPISRKGEPSRSALQLLVIV